MKTSPLTFAFFVSSSEVIGLCIFDLFLEKLISHTTHLKKMDQAVTFLVCVRKVLVSNPDLTPNILCGFTHSLQEDSEIIL